jgi:hypothetical protein
MHSQAIGLGSRRLVAVAAAVAGACSSGGATPSAGDAGRTNGGDDGAIAFDANAMDTLDAITTSPASDGGEPDGVVSSLSEASTTEAGACLGSAAAGGHCNSLTAFGGQVSVVCMSGETLPQASAGGIVANGQYVLTASEYYGACPTPEKDRITWLICGSSWQTAQESTLNGVTTNAYLNAFVSTSGKQASINLDCGQMAMTTFGYDATDTTLTLYQPSGSSAAIGRVDTFTRQ